MGHKALKAKLAALLAKRVKAERLPGGRGNSLPRNTMHPLQQRQGPPEDERHQA